MLSRSLYVHFPFCESKCHYCDFYSIGRERTGAADPALFEHALRAEASLAAGSLDTELDTIFFGGGTPSMTDPASAERALEPLFAKTSPARGVEWTMEANPSSIHAANMSAFRKLGVNRVSMGVQALRPDLLSLLGRVHSREQATRSLGQVFECGFENVSVDLLCGAPSQGLADLEDAMRVLCSFPITHLSCYLLTLPKHHRMYRELPEESIQLEHLMFIHEFMSARGFEHYEISNFAKPGKQARHNLVYWKGGSYLGLGPSAHSFDALSGKRWKNVSSLHRYGKLLEQGKSPVEWVETLDDKQRGLESWMLALRLAEGFPEGWLLRPEQREKAALFKGQGLLEPHPAQPGFLRLTARGFALSDPITLALA